jgi:hypothetical membrane protein
MNLWEKWKSAPSESRLLAVVVIVLILIGIFAEKKPVSDPDEDYYAERRDERIR